VLVLAVLNDQEAAGVVGAEIAQRNSDAVSRPLRLD